MPRMRQIFLCFFLTYSFSFSALAALPTGTFSSSEHLVIGDNIKLSFSTEESGKSGSLLQLPNGLEVTYGEILTFGDLYEIPNQSIAKGKTQEDRDARFLAAFNSFSKNKDSIEETQQLLSVIHHEQQYIQEGLERGETPEYLFKKLGLETDRQFNCITGGGCSTATWLLEPGRYLLLAQDYLDHFGDNAWITYQTGHHLAIAAAIRAHETQDLKQLHVAYALDAFAGHFLTDRFAAGHIRTPRPELKDKVTPDTVGMLLVLYMHNEENSHSIHVYNAHGDHWLAYGDKSYFNPNNNTHQTMINLALQHSADQIFTVYAQGVAPLDDMYDYIPQAEEVANKYNQDISAMFYWDNKKQKLMRRNDLKNLYDRHWTDDWWGWSTLLELKGLEELPPILQATLATSTWRAKALQDGLITDPSIKQFAREHL